MELRELQEQLEQAYNHLSEATRNYRTAAMVVRSREYDIESAKFELIREGKVTGKNQIERDAQMAEILEDEIGWLEGAKIEESEAYMSRELWQLRVDYLGKVLRILELLEERDEK